jgi:hypothetical protein
MTTLKTSQTSPLRLTEDGTIRIADSRVSLDSVVHHYKLGASAEQIAQKFPALDLADIYASNAILIKIMSKRQSPTPRFAICIQTDDADLLTPRMIYQVLPDESAAKSNYIRVIDNKPVAR